MARSIPSGVRKGRRKAALLHVGLSSILVAVLSGCAGVRSGEPEEHPIIATVVGLLPIGERSTDSAAAQVKYASIDFTLDGRGGLLILAQQQPGVTYWQTSQGQTVVLNRGYFSSTSGLEGNLEMTVLSGGDTQKSNKTPFPGDLDAVRHYRVSRLWAFGDQGREKTEQADAVLRCEPGTQRIKLPLATLPMRKCDESLHWQSGKVTRSTYWIDPNTNRIWKAETKPWPHSPTVNWSVARPWW